MPWEMQETEINYIILEERDGGEHAMMVDFMMQCQQLSSGGGEGSREPTKYVSTSFHEN